jgi:hypothetical protein
VAKTAIKLELEQEMLEEIDKRRGKGMPTEVPRVRFIRAALEAYLSPEPGIKKPYRQHVPGPDVEHIRSSAQIKADVYPIPKGPK